MMKSVLFMASMLLCFGTIGFAASCIHDFFYGDAVATGDDNA